MKKHLSVLMLFVRSTLYKFLIIIVAMAAVETIFFTLAYQNTQGLFMLDTILSACHLEIIWGVCFMLLCALLCLTGNELGSSYTLMRLRISQRAIFIWQSVHSAGLLFLFWAAQIGLAFGFCSLYTSRYPQPQGAMLVFYQNHFLHNLFPQADWSRHICNISILLSLAVTIGCFPVQMRRGKRLALLVIPLCLQVYTQDMWTFGLNLSYSAAIMLIALTAVWGIWREDYYEEVS